jgi:hypothetical protein
MAQWKLTDYSTGSAVEYTFPVNPREFTHPDISATVKNDQTVATSGSVIMFMGRRPVPTIQFGGSIRTEQQYDDLNTWMSKWNALELTDDQGSTWTIIITKYQPKRVKTANNQWRYNYTVDASVMDEVPSN